MEATMAVGKAEAQHPDRASTTGFKYVAPCYGSIDEAAIKDHLARDHFFWLDLTAPSTDDVEKLRELFGFHPLALEDLLHFGQRPKLDHYQDYIFLVFYGARDRAAGEGELLREVQMFVSGQYLVTVHQDELPALEEQRSRLDGLALHSEQFLLYRVFDALTDSFFPLLARMDDEIDALDAAVLAGPNDVSVQSPETLRRAAGLGRHGRGRRIDR
jgi:magnesium transporter